MPKSKRTKPVLFISHVHEDAAIAKRIKGWLDEKFAKSIEIFVSSDKSESLPGGTDWWDEIRDKLRRSDSIVALITRRSINRSWIFFEIGGGYFQKIRILPLLIGVKKEDIKSPLNQITYLDTSTKNDFSDFCSQLLSIYQLKTDLYNEDILNKVIKLDEEIGDTIHEERKSSTTFIDQARLDILDEDALNILESWMGKRQDRANTSVMYFSKIDDELNLPLGTSKRLIITAARRWHYEPVRQAEETILFKYVPPPKQRRTNWVTDY